MGGDENITRKGIELHASDRWLGVRFSSIYLFSLSITLFLRYPLHLVVSENSPSSVVIVAPKVCFFSDFHFVFLLVAASVVFAPAVELSPTSFSIV